MSTDSSDTAEVVDQGLPPFVMVPNELVDAGVSPQALAAFVHLRRFANWGTGTAEFSQMALAKRLGYSRRDSVRPYLDELVQLGWLVVEERFGANGARLRNAYVIPATPARSSVQPLPAGARIPRTLERAASTEDLSSEDLRTRRSASAAAKPEEPALIPELEKPADEVVRVIAEVRAAALGTKPSSRKVPAGARAAAARLAADVEPAKIREVLAWALSPAAADPWWLAHLVNAADVERAWDRLFARFMGAQKAVAAAGTNEGAAAPSSDHQRMLSAIGWSDFDWETAAPEERAGMRQVALSNGWRPTQAEAGAPAPARA